MEKCWFPLRDTHFPPPPSLASMRSGRPSSSSPTPSLGHLIPSLNRLDQIINADDDGFEPFPPNTMEIWGPTLIEDFSWDQSLTHKSTVKLKASAPLGLAGAAVIPGAELGVGVGAAFSKTVGNYWEFDRLERYIVQPTRSYVQRCIERDDVKRWIARNKKLGGRWEVYMVTGIIVARGGGRKRKEMTSEKGVFAEVTVEIPLIVGGGPEVKRERTRQMTWGGSQTNDFVWAVRLAKITKNGLQSDWKMETVVKKTSFRGQKAIF